MKSLKVRILFICLSLGLLAVPSFSKTTIYPWSKGPIEVSAEGILVKHGVNNAQDRILMASETRKSAYDNLLKLLLTLPLDSARNINALSKSTADFKGNLSRWITRHGILTDYVVTSDSTASAKISIQGEELETYIFRIDTESKARMAKADKDKKKKDKSAKTTSTVSKDSSEAKKSEEPQKYIEIIAQTMVAKDSTIPNSVRKSQAEAGVRALAKQDLYRQLDAVHIKEGVTIATWLSEHPEYKENYDIVVNRNENMEKPQWNKEETIVKVHCKLEIKSVTKVLLALETKPKDEKKKPGTKEPKTIQPTQETTK